MTVQALLDDWLETMRPHIRATTFAKYTEHCAHITRRIGKQPAQDVTTELVQRLATDLATAGIGPGGTRTVLTRLRAAYERLIPERFPANPVNWHKLKLRKSVRPERQPLDAAQVLRLLDASDDLAAQGGHVRWAIAVWLAALLGMRRGEIMGLTWPDVDLARAELHIRRQRAAGSPTLFSPPKTDESRRSIPLGPRLCARLRAHWESQQAERRHRGPAWHEHGLVVCNADGTPPSLNTLQDQLTSLAARLSLPHIHPHLLRHSIASLLDELGYSETIIGTILGHTAGASTTRRYTHARAVAVRRAIEAVEQAVFGRAEQTATGAV
jgi:integrase